MRLDHASMCPATQPELPTEFFLIKIWKKINIVLSVDHKNTHIQVRMGRTKEFV